MSKVLTPALFLCFPFRINDISGKVSAGDIKLMYDGQYCLFFGKTAVTAVIAAAAVCVRHVHHCTGADHQSRQREFQEVAAAGLERLSGLHADGAHVGFGHACDGERQVRDARLCAL